MRNRKIIYFDYWTAGVHNFKLIDEELHADGFETKLIHVGSWRDKNIPAYQRIDGIDCFDISYFSSWILFNVLEQEAPDVVVMLNASLITDRTVILSCRKLRIKTVYLMHGAITREEFIEDSIESSNQSFKINRLSRSIRHLRGTIPNYLYSLFKYNSSFLLRWYPYGLLIKTFTNPSRYINFPPPSFDLSPDLSLVYGNIDKRFYEKLFISTDSQIKVIGNPTLDRYFLELKDIASDRDLFLTQNSIPLDRPYITYIEEGLVEDKVWDNEYRIKFLKDILRVCVVKGFSLVVKLHPRTARGKHIDSLLELKEIIFIRDVNFSKLIYFTSKCISHYSTALIYPMLLDKPILMPRWGNSQFVQKLYKEEEVTFVNTLEQLGDYLEKDILEYDRSKYMYDYIPFTDGKTKERILNYILEITK